MGFRYRKSVKLGGLRINFSKSGIGYSYGVKGLRYTKTAKGKDRVTASIPGTGLSWTTESSSKRKSKISEPIKSQGKQPKETTRYTMPLVPNVIIGAAGIGLGEYYYFSHGYETGTAIFSGLILGAICYVGLYAVVGAVLMTLGVGKTENLSENNSCGNQESEPAVINESKEENFELEGVYYCSANVAKVAEPNPAWRKTCKALLNAGMREKKVYRFKRTVKPAELVEEPTNPHDRNAMMVQVDGMKVGYISAQEAPRVKELLKAGKIESATASIRGGDYKIVTSENNMVKDTVGPFIEVTVKYR